jgi:phosphonate transport system substrate-binding protein
MSPKGWIKANLLAAAAMAAFFLYPCPDAWAAGAQAGPLVLGIHPYLAPSGLVARFTPLAGYLEKKTGREVSVSISRDYQEHIARIGEGKLDLAYMGPASYVTLVSAYGPLRLLAAHEVKGKSSFRGVIIKRAGSGIMSLGDLRGKSFAFGDIRSTMSHLVPRHMLLEAGVDVGDLERFEHLNSHDNVALGVLMGDFDAGAVKEETFHKYRDRGLEPLEFSPVISEHLFVAGAGMPEALVGTLREAMLGLSSEPGARRILESVKPGTTGFVRADNRDYENLRHIMDSLKKAGAGP